MSQMCEYCRVLMDQYSRPMSKRARKHLLKRFSKHKKALHRNPPRLTPRRTKIARIAVKIAYRLYRKFKADGVPQFIIDRIPAEIRPYVVMTLDASGVKIIRKNPFQYKRVKMDSKEAVRLKNKGWKIINVDGFSGYVLMEKSKRSK